MAGGKRWFLYTTDDGDQFGILLDTSNTVAVNGTGKEYKKISRYALPRNIRPRALRFKSDDSKRVLKMVVLTPGQYATLVKLKNPFVSQDPMDSTRNLTVSGKALPETFTVTPGETDTGMTGLGPD